MIWLDEWKAWSAWFAAAADTVRLYSAGGAMADYSGAADATVTPRLLVLYRMLVEFHKRFGHQLPQGGERAIAYFISAQTRMKTFEEGRSVGLQGALRLTGELGMVKAEVDYFLSDKQVRARRASERAFTHLQRSIVADQDLRKKWQKAYKKTRGEEACEKLGALHLLLHGIWAFKAEAAGGKTDLILGGVVNEEEAMRAADAMVLTEWKVVKKGDDPAKRADDALVQAERYTRETLAGFELATYRYLVLLSEDFIPVPTVRSPPGRIYEVRNEVRNIAVSPSVPSKGIRATPSTNL